MDFNFDIEERGVFYPVSERVLINPARHESVSEILDTINHESLHFSLRDEELDEIQEHWAIKKIIWIDEYSKTL